MYPNPLAEMTSNATRVAIVCFINDPFDVPGGKRIGGGHVVLRDLAEFLVCRGFDVSLITRLNSPAKPEFQALGPRFRIFRVAVGPPEECPPARVGTMLDDLEQAARAVLCDEIPCLTAIHSQYWIAGEVCRRINTGWGLRHVHHMLSFGRQKARLGEEANATDKLRDDCEIAVVNAADVIVAQCPSEARDLIQYYPELSHRRIAIIPHGIDTDVFCP
jgi:D-inositol-3-phosphate glycosyltransferase